MLNKKRIHVSCFPKSRLFLFKLYDILNDNENNDIIHWSSDDQSIIIANVNMLCNKVLPKYYKHTNYSSFVRQLNIYGFNKRKDVQKNKECECYIHEKFNKNISKQQIMEITKQNKRIKIFSKLIKNQENKFDDNKDLIINDKDDLFKYLINKVMDNKKYLNGLKNDVSNLRNKNNKLFEKLKKIKDNFNGHKILLNKFLNNIVNKKTNITEQKSKNIKELFKKYLYYLHIYSPFVTFKNQNINLWKKKVESFSIYNENNKNNRNNHIEMFNYNINNISFIQRINFNNLDSSYDDDSFFNNI